MTKKADWRIEDLEDRVAAAEQMLAEAMDELRRHLNKTPREDTSSPESVRYHIEFHRSQQAKIRNKTETE